jgi:hypothetical protein
MWTKAEALELDKRQRNTLEKLVRARSTSQKMVMRARIILMAADGWSNNAVGKALGVNRKCPIPNNPLAVKGDRLNF